MQGTRWVVGVVAVMLVATVASGPLVGAVDLTSARQEPTIGHGNVSVGTVEFPENATLTEARFGAGSYYLEVPATSMELRNVTGQPRLAYEIEIEDLGYTRSSVYSVSSDDEGTYSLNLSRDSLKPGKIEAESYEATLSITHMSNHTTREIASTRVTVEVVE